MKRWIAPSVAVVVMVVGIAAAYRTAAVSSRSGSSAPAYSTRRHDPYGTAALHDLLVERGVPVRTLERPSLEPGDRGVLIQVLPAPRKDHREEGDRLSPRQIADWIVQGNTVVQLSRAPTALMARFKIVPTTQPTDAAKVEAFEESGGLPDLTPAVSYLARWDSRASADPALHPLDGRNIQVLSPMRFATQTDPAWKPLATLPLDHDAVVAGEYRVGTGRLILIGAPTPALNETLGDEANLDLMLALIGKGPVILDEWSHGVGHEATIIGFIHDAGLLPVLFQLGFLVALYVWSTSGYRREAEAPPPRRRSSIEQIETLGYLYSRALSSDVTFDRIDFEVQRRLADALRCQPGEIRKRIAGLSPALREKFDQLFVRLNAARPAVGTRCPTCGYELHANVSGRCPECGMAITALSRQRIADNMRENPTGVQRRQSARDAVFAEVLRVSHELSKEAQIERRGSR